MTKIIPFLFNAQGKNHEVRAIVINGEEHFVGKDVCDALGYANASKAMGDHCRGVTIRYPIADSLGRMQESRVLTEADVLRLIVNSTLPAADAFERWVFEEVLPAIRKTGSYQTHRSAHDPSKLTGALAIAECFTRLLKPAPSSQVAMLAHIAKDYGINPGFLPSYVVDAAPGSITGSSMETKPLTDLLKIHGIKIGVRAYNCLLEDAGFLKDNTRRSGSTASGVKHFWTITDAGLHYGKNLTNPGNARETQPHWYVERFAELHERIASLATAEARDGS